MVLGDAIREECKWGKTWNGADTLKTTESALLDMFGRAGAMRGTSEEDKRVLISRALEEDAEAALKLLFYTRDIRGGYGERVTFRTMLNHIANIIPVESMAKNMWAIMEFGRADDLYALLGTRCESVMWEFMRNQFELDCINMAEGKSISLLAKWIATPDSSVERTRELGKLTAKMLGYDFKTMRRFKNKLRAMRKYLDIPEAKMCTGRWSEIEYSKCSSKFLFKYRNAIERHDGERWQQYLAEVSKGKTNMNMNTVTPADIIHKVYTNYTPDLEVMWQQLPKVCEANAMVICDTSGSMIDRYSMRNGVLPIDVAFGLALYFSQHNCKDLRNLMMNFSDTPEFIKLDASTLRDNLSIAMASPVNYSSTDLEAAFDLLLSTMIKCKITQEDMPQAIMIISDMQINCVEGVDKDHNMLFYDLMKQRYADAGYELPQVIFWNVNAANPTFHASRSSRGVSLVSGYSPNIMKQVMKNIGTTPYELMQAIINDERYKEIKL